MKITNKFLSFFLIIIILASFFSVPTLAETADDNGAVAFEFNSAEVINSLSYVAADRILKVDTDNANSYSVTALLDAGTQAQAHIYFNSAAVDAFNNANYNYVNVLIRNGQSTAQEMAMYVLYNSKGKATLQPGWNIVSLPKRDMVNADNVTYTTGSSIRFVPSARNSGDIYNIDKIWLTADKVTASALSLENTAPSDKFNDMGILDASVTFEFNQDVQVSSKDAFFVSEANEKISATLTAKGKTVFVKADKALLPDTAYTLDSGKSRVRSPLGIPFAGKLSKSFTTSADTLSIGIINAVDSLGEEVTSTNSDTVYLSAKALNTGAGKESVIIGATVVSPENGQATTVLSSAFELPAQMTEPQSIPSFEVSAVQGCKLIAFVISASDELSPLSTSYLVVENDEKLTRTYLSGSEKSESVSVSLEEPALNVDTLTIKGKTDGYPEGLAMVSIREKESGKLTAIFPVVCTKTGDFSCSYVFDGTNSGWYEVSAIVKGATDAASKQTYYLGDGTKEEIRAAFDSDTVSVDDATEILQKWRDGMGIASTYDDELISHMAAVLCEQKPYNTYASLIEVMNLSVTALDELNDASWSTFADVTDKYSIILNNDESLEDFEEYGASGKAEIYKIAVKSSPFANFADFREAIAKGTKTYAKKLEEEKQASRRPSSSGGGGGGGSISVGSSSASQLIEEAEKPIADTASGKAEFADFSSDHWAYSSVNELSSRNIIVGYEDGSFRPDKAVTRAEFVKMLVGAFAFSEGKGEKFDDVPEDAWYKDFLARASSAGVVKGADGKFNPDAAITRQDAALMLYRSLAHKNAKIDGNANFADEHMLSDYASEAVKALAGTGLISGYEDGCFAPKNKITRAETAKLIYSAICYLTGGEAK